MRLLLVEDDVTLGESLVDVLRGLGYAVDWVVDGVAAAAALRDPVYELALLDLRLPRRDGLRVLQDYREERGQLPILVISALDAVEDRVRGFALGADDYLSKPFDLDELLARVRALLRRSGGRITAEITHGRLVVDPAARTARLDGEPLHLSAREFALLLCLLQQPGQIVSRRSLEERIYGWGTEVESNTVEVYVHALRRKLGSQFIQTVRGLGYRVT